MVAQLNPPTAPDLTRADIVAQVQDKIDNDKLTPNAAIVAVYEQIVAEGRLLELALLHGRNLVGDLWRAWNITNRPAAVSRTMGKPVRPAADAISSALPPGRVVDVGALRVTALMDGLYKLDDQWVRLGDMDKGLCHKAFKAYRSAAQADEHNAQYFRLIEAQLGDGETVEARFTEADLMRFYRRTKPTSTQVPTT